jgi:hydroxypyruvate reductase
MCDCVIAAGETVVTVRGKGLGGRNQELACAAALALADIRDTALIALGTDGTDGPTDAAGGIIDGETYSRTDLRKALDANDCYHALEAADGLVRTGPTQTNLNDLVVIARIA